MAPRRQRPGLQSGPDDRHLRSTGVLCAVAGTLAMAHDITQPSSTSSSRHDVINDIHDLARGPVGYGLGCLGDGDARHPGSRLDPLEAASSMSTVAAVVGARWWLALTHRSALIDPGAVQPTTTVHLTRHPHDVYLIGRHASTGRSTATRWGYPSRRAQRSCRRRRDYFSYTRRRIDKSHPMETPPKCTLTSTYAKAALDLYPSSRKRRAGSPRPFSVAALSTSRLATLEEGPQSVRRVEVPAMSTASARSSRDRFGARTAAARAST